MHWRAVAAASLGAARDYPTATTEADSLSGLEGVHRSPRKSVRAIAKRLMIFSANSGPTIPPVVNIITSVLISRT